MTTPEQTDADFAKRLLERAAGDLAVILDREFTVGEVTAERATEKGVSPDAVHVSFRQEYTLGDEVREGCVLLPLPEAVALGGYLTMLSDADVASRRERAGLDREAKGAMVEIATFFCGSIESVLRGWLEGRRVEVDSNGCQGVAPGDKPNFLFAEGQELILARAEMSLHEFPSFQAVAMLPSELSSAPASD